MNEIIHITERAIGGEAVQTIDARELHEFLEAGKAFGAWLPDRIAKYGFTEGVDYLVSETGIQVPHQGGTRSTTRIDYHLTIDMAKELAMVERNAKGKQARTYFIECERRAKDAANQPLRLDDPAALRSMLLGYTEKVIALESKVHEVEAVIEKQAPKVEAFDRIATVTDGSFCLTDAAKLLQLQPKRLFQELQAMEWIHRRPMGTGWLAYQVRIQQGLLEHKITTGEKSDGTEWASTQVRVTAKGLSKLSELLRRQAA